MPKFKGAIWDSFDALCSKVITSKIPTSASFSTGTEALLDVGVKRKSVCVGGGGGHRETETDRQTETERQTETVTDRQRCEC